MKPLKHIPALRAALATGLMLLSTVAGIATPLRMDYTVNPSGSGYAYEFRLILDNHDNTWAAGQGWSWIIFGDRLSATSVIHDFAADVGTFPLGPFVSLGLSGGGHNGPTFQPVVGAYWTPSAVGEFLQWSGTSSGFLDAGQMLFSSLNVTGGASWVEFEPAHRVASLDAQAVPDGGYTLALMGCALTGLGLVGKRRKDVTAQRRDGMPGLVSRSVPRPNNNQPLSI
jgi:hypothetical protein